jgi:IclR family transcriptional regulator, pca regulon regulatory protein
MSNARKHNASAAPVIRRYRLFLRQIILLDTGAVKGFCSINDICSYIELSMKLKATDTLGSFAKGLSVIEAFSAEHPRLAIADVSQGTGLDRATARRCLLTLSNLGYADYDGKYFSLTPRVLRLGTACLGAMPLPKIVQPWLDKLSHEIGQSTSVSILDDWEIVYVARAAQQRLMSISLMPGSRLPASCASMGRVLLASLPDLQLRSLLKKHPPQKRTIHSITDIDKLMSVVEKARKDGYAIADQELEIGLRSIAVPITDSKGRTIAAINVGVAAIHDKPEELRKLYLGKLLDVQKSLRPLLA